jgi:hypothetical protein
MMQLYRWGREWCVCVRECVHYFAYSELASRVEHSSGISVPTPEVRFQKKKKKMMMMKKNRRKKGRYKTRMINNELLHMSYDKDKTVRITIVCVWGGGGVGSLVEDGLLPS